MGPRICSLRSPRYRRSCLSTLQTSPTRNYTAKGPRPTWSKCYGLAGPYPSSFPPTMEEDHQNKPRSPKSSPPKILLPHGPRYTIPTAIIRLCRCIRRRHMYSYLHQNCHVRRFRPRRLCRRKIQTAQKRQQSQGTIIDPQSRAQCRRATRPTRRRSF